ncbi:MAG: hypothetical protein ACQ9MH_06695 [Nitrospinales bacterium]
MKKTKRNNPNIERAIAIEETEAINTCLLALIWAYAAEKELDNGFTITLGYSPFSL